MNSVAIAGVFSVWFLRELSIAGREAQDLRDPAPGGSDLVGPLESGRGKKGEPQAAVGAEALLRREVVGVGLDDVDRDATGRDVPSISTSASGSAPATRSTGARAPVEVSLCAQAYTSASSTALGRPLSRPEP